MAAPGPGGAAVRIKKPMQRRAEKTRARIVDAARAVFAEEGFDAATTTMIAQRAEVSIGSVYAHFEDKIEIFLEILAAHSEEVYRYAETKIEEIIGSDEDLATAVDRLIPGLYRAHTLSGKLNFEMNRFVLMNERAEAIHAEWEAKEDELIVRFLDHFRDRIRADDLCAASIIVHRLIHEVFVYLFKNRDRVDEESLLATLVQMITGGFLSPRT
jgi:AcrR family transcriptional regulator